MFKAFISRLKQGYRTSPYPRKEVQLPARYRGRPVISESPAVLSGVCPSGALTAREGKTSLDLGLCIFCGSCARVSGDRISFSGDYRLAAAARDALVMSAGDPSEGTFAEGGNPALLLEKKIRRTFRRSLRLRQVSAGGCNACEADINVLSTLFFDIGRFGIQMTASPRHADGIIVTGPVTKNMEEALLKTWDAVPSPKLVIASGACAISGGLFADSEEAGTGVSALLPVSLYIPGCPPHPMTILHGLLAMLDRL